MRKIRLFSSVVLTISFVVAPVIAVGVAADPGSPFSVERTAPDWVVSVDCSVPVTSSMTVPYSPGATLTMHLLNCGSHFWAYPFDVARVGEYPGGATNDGSHFDAPADNVFYSNNTFTVDPNTSFSTIDGASSYNYALGFEVVDSVLDNPPGVLKETTRLIIGTSADEFSSGLGPNSYEAYEIAGDPNCAVQPGPHVYATQQVTVTEAGEYTFRVVDTYPSTSPGYTFREMNTLELNGIALYSTFDPSNVDGNYLGCGSTGGVIPGGFNTVGTQTGYSVSEWYGSFSVTLQPGSYTLVGFPSITWSSAQWAAGAQNGGAPLNQALTIETWGPSDTQLADTGRDAWSDNMLITVVAFVIGLGLALVVIRRRRS